MAVYETAVNASTCATPPSWTAETAARTRFFEEIGKAARPLLICDYDGTLAPFQLDKMQARAYPGVAERLAQIAKGRTRLAFVSGRPVRELMELLPLAAEAEIWGMHGREHRTADGAYRLIEPKPEQRASLDEAEKALGAEFDAMHLQGLIERKAASVAVHWRTIDPEQQSAALEQVKGRSAEIFRPYGGQNGLGLLPFDGGLELRAEDQTKGHATEALLADSDAGSSVFLGDDTTDEDAFRVLRRAGGIGLLVREVPRSSEAHFSLVPPEELLGFFDDWLAALQ